jgi:hypothetical protein
MNAEVERDWPCCLCPDGLTPGRELKRLLQWTNGFNGQHVFLDLEIEVSTTGRAYFNTICQWLEIPTYFELLAVLEFGYTAWACDS